MQLLAAIGVWCLFVCAAFACRLYCHGSVEARLGETAAHRRFVLTAALSIFALGTFYLAEQPATDSAALLRLGGLWLALSLGFDLLLGRVVLGMSWPQVWRNYNLLRGRLYPLLLLSVFFTPLASYHLFFN